MNNSRILYGGFEGKDDEICENATSLGELLLRKFSEAGDKVLLIDAITDEKLTGNDLRTKSIRLARKLRQLFDIKSGDAVGVCSENRLEFAITLHATLLLGATIAPYNVTYTEHEIRHAVSLSKPKVVFVSPTNLEKFSNARRHSDFIKQLIVYDSVNSEVWKSADPIEAKTRHSEAKLFSQLIESSGAESTDSFVCEPQNMRENVAYIMCSSGTTGLPKGVQLTQFNMLVANLQHYNRSHASEDIPNGERIILGILPWFHAFGMCVLTVMALRSTKIVFLPKFEEVNFLRSIEAYRANTLYTVPPIMVLLAKSPLIDKYDLSSLQVIWFGAAPCSEELISDVRKRLGVRVFRQGYGMTEITFALTGQTDEFHSAGSVGVLRSGVWGRVVDLESGKCLGPLERGEVQFKGSCLMKGYVGNSQATDATIDRDGWIHTGDVGYYDHNGEWYIVDRIKELIKYKGYQVPPAEIEAILLTNPRIKDAAVIGVPDDVAGELPCAFVVKQPEAVITEEEVAKFVAERLSPAKRLHGGVHFVNEIPKNPSGKILRRVLRDLIKKQKAKL